MLLYDLKESNVNVNSAIAKTDEKLSLKWPDPVMSNLINKQQQQLTL